MIQILQQGKYTLTNASQDLSLLWLEKKIFGWQHAEKGDQLFLSTPKENTPVQSMHSGNYRVYGVKGEKDFVHGTYLELFNGKGWDGYMLPQGLPTKVGSKKKILPTQQTITKVTH